MVSKLQAEWHFKITEVGQGAKTDQPCIGHALVALHAELGQSAEFPDPRQAFIGEGATALHVEAAEALQVGHGHHAGIRHTATAA